MTPDSKSNPAKTARTLKTLLRVGKALLEPEQTKSGNPDQLRDSARRAADSVRHDPRVQGAADRVTELRSRAGNRADERLAELIREKRARQGQRPPEEVTALLEQRRQERDEKLGKTHARQALLAHAENGEQRRVLHLIATHTPWAGGEGHPVRYTQLLDQLAPGGQAEAEMSVHRALWTLAERRVLAVSPHGVITAIQTLTAVPEALPEGY